jgi:hypothetical protein
VVSKLCSYIHSQVHRTRMDALGMRRAGVGGVALLLASFGSIHDPGTIRTVAIRRISGPREDDQREGRNACRSRSILSGSFVLGIVTRMMRCEA